jgi:hypothetical protein
MCDKNHTTCEKYHKTGHHFVTYNNGVVIEITVGLTIVSLK